MASRSIICRSRRLRWIIDLRDIRSPSLLFNEYPREAKRSAIFTQERSQEGEKHGFLYACAEYYLPPNTVGRHCAWAGHYLYAVICGSRGGLSANEKKEKFASNGKSSSVLVCLLFYVLFITKSTQNYKVNRCKKRHGEEICKRLDFQVFSDKDDKS